jgi:hypothetical protein
VKKKIRQSGASQKSNQDHSCLLFCPKKARRTEETKKKLVKSSDFKLDTRKIRTIPILFFQRRNPKSSSNQNGFRLVKRKIRIIPVSLA